MSAPLPILSQSEIVKIAAIAALLQSPMDGEALAACRALLRRLDKHGLTISDVMAKALSPAPCDEPASFDHGAVAEQCLQYPDLFNDFELSFLTDIRSFVRLSAKQRRLLKAFAGRLARNV